MTLLLRSSRLMLMLARARTEVLDGLTLNVIPNR